jgi:hypothetical protein
MDREASKSYDLANALLIECIQAAQPSYLETAVFLLRDALTRRPVSHPNRSDSLNDLAEALVVGFWHSGQPQDLKEAIVLHREACKLREDGLEAVTDVSDESQLRVHLLLNWLHSDHEQQYFRVVWPLNDMTFKSEDQGLSEMIRLAHSNLSNFHQEAEISSLDAAISLHQNALHLWAAPHMQRSASLRGLGLAFAARSYRTGQIQDLHEAISPLGQALALLLKPDSNRLILLHGLGATHLTRFGKMKNIRDLRNVMLLYIEAEYCGFCGSGSRALETEGNHEPEPYVRTTNQHYFGCLKPFAGRDPGQLGGVRLPLLKLEE